MADDHTSSLNNGTALASRSCGDEGPSLIWRRDPSEDTPEQAAWREHFDTVLLPLFQARVARRADQA